MNIFLRKSDDVLLFDDIVESSVREVLFKKNISEEKQISEIIEKVMRIFNENFNIIRDKVFSKENFIQEAILEECISIAVFKYVNALINTELDAENKIDLWTGDIIDKIEDSIDFINMTSFINRNDRDREHNIIEGYSLKKVYKGSIRNKNYIEDLSKFDEGFVDNNENKPGLIYKKDIDINSNLVSLVYNLKLLNTLDLSRSFIDERNDLSQKIGLNVLFSNEFFNIACDGIYLKLYFENDNDLEYEFSQSSDINLDGDVYLNSLPIIRHASGVNDNIKKRDSVINNNYILLGYTKNEYSAYNRTDTYYSFNIKKFINERKTINIKITKIEAYFYKRNGDKGYGELFSLNYNGNRENDFLLYVKDYYNVEENYDDSVHLTYYNNNEYTNFYKIIKPNSSIQLNNSNVLSNGVILSKNMGYKLVEISL